MRTTRFVIAIFLALPLLLAAQTNSIDDIFTIKVTAPVSPKDVQVRYFLGGDPAVQQSSSIAKPDDARIIVKTGAEGKPARSFRAIVYSPGCQFVTIKADDLSASTRQAAFECQKLSTTPLHGKADISRFAGKDLKVEALYVCGWAGKFFGVPGMAISPLSVGGTKMESDGTFAMDLPDFSGDPMWANLSHNATLVFSVVDGATGEELGRLSAPRDLSRRGSLKVAQSYPAEIQFAVR
ncbi:MAG: hypothetical protein WA738_00490 [Candidatus Angelobacter sp.]